MNNLIRDIAFYFSRKIGIPLANPDTLQISITNRCNLRCKSCSVWRNVNLNEELNLEEIKDIIDEADDWGVKELNLCGGEVFLYEDWPEVVKYAKRKHMHTTICSNGTLIDNNIVDKIKNSGLETLCISLDGPSREIQDLLRGEGTYDKIINGIEIINKFDNELRLRMVLILTVSNKNLFALKEYIDLAYSLSVQDIYFTALVLDNVYLSSKEKMHDLWMEEAHFSNLDKIFKEVYDYAKSRGYYLDYPSFELFPKYFRKELRRGEWVCFSGLKRLVVIPNGDIQICGEVVGNYRKTKSLRKIWFSYIAYRKRRFVKNCKNYCLQDCHARNESASFRNILKNFLKK